MSYPNPYDPRYAPPMGNSDGGNSHDALVRAITSIDARLAKLGDERRPQGLVPRFVEDIPGKRVPYKWVITVAFDSAITNNSAKTGSATLSEDGPFVITAYNAFWQVTTLTSGEDADVQNAFLPPGRMPWLFRAATAAPVIPRDAIDFLVSIQLAGGGRLWQNTAFPAITLYNGEYPNYVGIPGLVERNETMTLQVTAQVSGTAGNAPDSGARGTFWFVMDGYKILRPIDYAEAQGWTP